MADLTTLLESWSSESRPTAPDDLLRRVYRDLCCIAGRQLASEGPGHTLSTRDLVHEAFLKLEGQKRVSWQSRRHFFSIASRLMRRVLIDHARKKGYAKHGGGLNRVTLSHARELGLRVDAEVVDIDQALQALQALEAKDSELAQTVVLRFFGGFDHREIADILGVSEPTARRRYRLAKAWLRQELSQQRTPVARPRPATSAAERR